MYLDYNGVWEMRGVSYCLNYYRLLSLDTVPIGKHKNLPTTVAYFMGFEKRHPCRPDCPKQPKIENSCWKCVSRSIYVSSNLWLKMGLPFSAFFLLKTKCKQRSGSLWKLRGDNSSLNQIFKFRNKICLILTSFYATFQCGRYNI